MVVRCGYTAQPQFYVRKDVSLSASQPINYPRVIPNKSNVKKKENSETPPLTYAPPAGRGIGREMALELGRRGAKVIVNYANSKESAEEVVQQIKKNGTDAASVRANVSKVPEIVALFEEAIKIFGKLHIVCSNSGVVSFGHVKDVTEEEFDRVFATNTRGQFFVAREAYKHLEVGGRLILMGSITGQAKGVPAHSVYSGSKGAIETFVRCMAIDFGDKKITVNGIAPGGIKTDMYHAVCREYIPSGMTLTDEEVDEVSNFSSKLALLSSRRGVC